MAIVAKLPEHRVHPSFKDPAYRTRSFAFRRLEAVQSHGTPNIHWICWRETLRYHGVSLSQWLRMFKDVYKVQGFLCSFTFLQIWEISSVQLEKWINGQMSQNIWSMIFPRFFSKSNSVPTAASALNQWIQAAASRPIDPTQRWVEPCRAIKRRQCRWKSHHPKEWYPLVNVYIAMEIHHVSWENSLYIHGHFQ